jgi:hypothetical protein
LPALVMTPTIGKSSAEATVMPVPASTSAVRPTQEPATMAASKP